MKKEINLVSQILDSKHVLKTYTTQTEVSDDLINYYQVNDFFIEVEKELISAVVEKCQGNPQLCISLVYQLLIVTPLIFICIEWPAGDQREDLAQLLEF
jgi:hypothetical protein